MKRKYTRKPTNITSPVLGIEAFYPWEFIEKDGIPGALIDKSIADIIDLLNNKYNCVSWVSCSGLNIDHAEKDGHCAYVGFKYITKKIFNKFIEAGWFAEQGNYAENFYLSKHTESYFNKTDQEKSEAWERLRKLL